MERQKNTLLLSKSKVITRQKQINHKYVNHFKSDKSSHSTLSIDPNEALVNNIGHDLFQLALHQTHEERRQAIIQQKNKTTKTTNERQASLNKKNKLTLADINRLFEEKRLRSPTIKNDLMDLYQKSTDRIRSMLNIDQIDQFIQTTQNRKNI